MGDPHDTAVEGAREDTEWSALFLASYADNTNDDLLKRHVKVVLDALPSPHEGTPLAAMSEAEMDALTDDELIERCVDHIDRFSSEALRPVAGVEETPCEQCGALPLRLHNEGCSVPLATIAAWRATLQPAAPPAVQGEHGGIEHPLDLLAECGAQFRYYVSQHKAKGTSDGDRKAAVNEALADRIEVVLEDQARTAARQSQPAGDDVLAEVREALEWYAEQVEGCRKAGNLGLPAQRALDADGGGRARKTLSHLHSAGQRVGEGQ